MSRGGIEERPPRLGGLFSFLLGYRLVLYIEFLFRRNTICDKYFLELVAFKRFHFNQALRYGIKKFPVLRHDCRCTAYRVIDDALHLRVYLRRHAL